MRHSIKTIDITCKEWFDRVNGNSYFSAVVTLNFGLPSSRTICLPFQYGYGDHYRDMAFKAIQANVNKSILKDLPRFTSLSSFCMDNSILLRANKIENCLKRDVVQHGIA